MDEDKLGFLIFVGAEDVLRLLIYVGEEDVLRLLIFVRGGGRIKIINLC